MTHEELLHDLYYNLNNLDGANQLYLKAKVRDPSITLDIVKEWSKKQTANQLTERKVGAKNIYLPIYSDIPYAFQIDLTFFPRYLPQNDGYGIFFTAININTRYVYAFKTKHKDMDTILDVIKEMEKQTVINSFTSDDGGEFNNKQFKDYCMDNNITNYFITDDSHKLGIVNRFHRTLKEKITKYFIAHNTVRWVDIIDDIVKNYNHSINRGIGIEPFKVNAIIENEIIQEKRSQTGIIKPTLDPFIVGDIVRLKRKVITFDDKMLSKYHNKQHTIVGVTANSLNLVDANGNNMTVKKSTAQKVNMNNDVIINPIVAHIIPNAIEQANNEHQHNLRDRRAGIDLNNIIEGPRVRRVNPLFVD